MDRFGINNFKEVQKSYSCQRSLSCSLLTVFQFLQRPGSFLRRTVIVKIVSNQCYLNASTGQRVDRKCYIAFKLRERTTQSGSTQKPNRHVAFNFYPCIRNAKHKSITIKRCKLTLLTCKSCCLISKCKIL